jgi:hypothetical protein
MKKADVRQHFVGAREKKPSKSHKLSHADNMEAMHKQKTRLNILQKAVVLNTEAMMDKANADLKGATLSIVTATRAKVLEDLFVLGVPTAKLDNRRLVDLIETPHANFGGRSGVRDHFPVVKSILMERIREGVKGREVSIFFDASKVNFLLEAVMCRFLNDDLLLQLWQLCPRVLTRNLFNCCFANILMRQVFRWQKVVCAISDSGLPNPTAMKAWNDRTMEMYLGEELINEKLFWIPCLMHCV